MGCHTYPLRGTSNLYRLLGQAVVSGQSSIVSGVANNAPRKQIYMPSAKIALRYNKRLYAKTAYISGLPEHFICKIII